MKPSEVRELMAFQWSPDFQLKVIRQRLAENSAFWMMLAEGEEKAQAWVDAEVKKIWDTDIRYNSITPIAGNPKIQTEKESHHYD